MTQSKVVNVGSGGIGLPGLLTVAFIVLKLAGVISWSWLWVLSPIWIPLSICLAVIVFALIMAKLTGQWPKRKKK
jgi:hypothetical protein